MSKKAVADTVVFEAKDQSWTMRLTPGAFIELEDKGFGNIETLGAKMEENPSFKTFLAIMLAGLRFTKEDITEGEALAIANEVGSQKTAKMVGDLIAASFSDIDADTGGNAPPKA